MAGPEFSQATKGNVAKAAAYCCSMCRRSTLKPIEGQVAESHYIGNVAHISAKSATGPRYHAEWTDDQRADPDNALFVCWNCHNVIDDMKSVSIYTEQWLRDLRQKHHEIARMVFDQVVPQETTVMEGALETEGVGEITGVKIRDAAVIFKSSFSSKVSGVGKVTNVEITGRTAQTETGVFFGRSLGGGPSTSHVASNTVWRCSRCGLTRSVGFGVGIIAGSASHPDEGPPCRTCRIPMIRG